MTCQGYSHGARPVHLILADLPVRGTLIYATSQGYPDVCCEDPSQVPLYVLDHHMALGMVLP